MHHFIVRTSRDIGPPCYSPDREHLVSLWSNVLFHEPAHKHQHLQRRLPVPHSIGRSIRIVVSPGGDSITVRMISEGSATGSTTPGLGLRDLQARGAIIRLDPDDGSTTVTATLSE